MGWRQDYDRIATAKPNKTLVWHRKTDAKIRNIGLERRLVEWVHDMRKNRSLCKYTTFGKKSRTDTVFPLYSVCVTTECFKIMAGRYEPEFVRDKSANAMKMFFWRLMKRNRLSVRRITHRGTKRKEALRIAFSLFVAICRNFCVSRITNTVFRALQNHFRTQTDTALRKPSFSFPSRVMKSTTTYSTWTKPVFTSICTPSAQLTSWGLRTSKWCKISLLMTVYTRRAPC